MTLTVGRKEYRTMFYYGSNVTICSRHRTLMAAVRAAKACERRGGAKHWIEVVERIRMNAWRERTPA